MLIVTLKSDFVEYVFKWSSNYLVDSMIQLVHLRKYSVLKLKRNDSETKVLLFVVLGSITVPLLLFWHMSKLNANPFTANDRELVLLHSVNLKPSFPRLSNPRPLVGS